MVTTQEKGKQPPAEWEQFQLSVLLRCAQAARAWSAFTRRVEDAHPGLALNKLKNACGVLKILYSMGGFKSPIDSESELLEAMAEPTGTWLMMENENRPLLESVDEQGTVKLTQLAEGVLRAAAEEGEDTQVVTETVEVTENLGDLRDKWREMKSQRQGLTRSDDHRGTDRIPLTTSE